MTSWTTVPLPTSARYEIVAATGEFYEPAQRPRLYLHRRRRNLRVDWKITAVRYGEVLTFGRRWTQGGAFDAAMVATRKPSLYGGER